MVQQDPDTYIDWMVGRVSDNGNLFFDRKGKGISIKEAAKRIRNSRGDRHELDVYHKLFVFLLGIKA